MVFLCNRSDLCVRCVLGTPWLDHYKWKKNPKPTLLANCDIFYSCALFQIEHTHFYICETCSRRDVCNKAARLFYIKGGRVDIFIATLKNGCRHTMEGSTMPPQGPLWRRGWLLLLLCPFVLPLFFMARFERRGAGCKTEGKIIERSRPYRISLDGKFPLLEIFFSLLRTSYYSGQAVYSARLWKRE